MKEEGGTGQAGRAGGDESCRLPGGGTPHMPGGT